MIKLVRTTLGPMQVTFEDDQWDSLLSLSLNLPPCSSGGFYILEDLIFL